MKRIKNCPKCQKDFVARKESVFCSRICSNRFFHEKRGGKYREFKFYIRRTRKRSSKKGWYTDLDEKFLFDLFHKQGGLCAMTQIPMKLNSNKYTKEEKCIYYASLDRIDNKKGYTKTNVHFVCLGINYLRNTFTLEETINFLKKVNV